MVKPNADFSSFVQPPEGIEPIFKKEEILKALLPVQVKERIMISPSRRIDDIVKPAQIQQVGEAALIFTWKYNSTANAFSSDDYWIGYALSPSLKRDPRLDLPSIELNSECNPIKDCNFDVYKRISLRKGAWFTDSLADEWVYERSDYNGGLFIKHPAVWAYEMLSGKNVYIHGKETTVMNQLLRSYRRVLWIANGYPRDEFKKVYESAYKTQSAEMPPIQEQEEEGDVL